MNDALLWMLWVFIFVLGSGYVFFGVKQFKSIYKQPYRFQHHLPFELHSTPLAFQNRFQPLNGLLISFLIALFAYWEGLFVYPSLPITFLLLGLMVIFLFSLMSIFILQPKRIEIYIGLVSSFFVSLIAVLFLSSYLTFTSPFHQLQTFLPWTTLAQAILQLGILFNPQLKDWALMEKLESANEKPLYRRPSNFVMAYTQWLSIANLMVWVLLTQIEWIIG